MGLARALALEAARKNVTVNAVAPSYCNTGILRAMQHSVLHDIPPASRPAQYAKDVVRIIDMASVSDGDIAGATLHSDGGLYMA